MNVDHRATESDFVFGVKVISVSFVLSLSYVVVGLTLLTDGHIVERFMSTDDSS